MTERKEIKRQKRRIMTRLSSHTRRIRFTILAQLISIHLQFRWKFHYNKLNFSLVFFFRSSTAGFIKLYGLWCWQHRRRHKFHHCFMWTDAGTLFFLFMSGQSFASRSTRRLPDKPLWLRSEKFLLSVRRTTKPVFGRIVTSLFTCQLIC